VNELILKLKNSLYDAVSMDSVCGLLYSGGLDSSIIAAINPRVKAINVSLESYGEDISYARLLAKVLDLDYVHRKVEIEEAIEAIPEIVRMLQTFDLALPNDIVVYFALKKAKEMGIKKILTGDGSDELFAGYSFMLKMKRVEEYIEKISGSMRFSSNDIADFFGLNLVQPFLNKRVVDLALSMPSEVKIKKDTGGIWGKWILRKAFEDVLPKKIIWQTKRPLELGSGMEKIRKIITSKITDVEWEYASENLPIKFMNREHYYYYKVYKKVAGSVPKPERKEKACQACGAGMKKNAFHCKICGYVSNWEIKK